MTPIQQKKMLEKSYSKKQIKYFQKQENFLNRVQKKQTIKNAIIEILWKAEQNEESPTLEKIRQELIKLHYNNDKKNFPRNTFNYWINLFIKEGFFKRKEIDDKIFISKQGNPKTLIFNPKYLKHLKECKAKSKKRRENYEKEALEDMIINKILWEIEHNQNLEQHKKLIKLFKEFGKENFGEKLIFLTQGNYIKLNYSFEFTDKGRKALEKLKKKKSNS